MLCLCSYQENKLTLPYTFMKLRKRCKLRPNIVSHGQTQPTLGNNWAIINSPLLPVLVLGGVGGVNPWLILRVSTKGKFVDCLNICHHLPWVEQGPVSVMKMLDKNPVV